MWKLRSGGDDKSGAGVPTVPATPLRTVAGEEVSSVEPKSVENRTEVANIGKSVLVKGELSGSEDLYLEGEVEGTIELRGHALTIGQHGRVHAHTQARDVIVHGKVDGNIQAERVELRKSAIVTGDIVTKRVVVEDGAFFKGSIDIQRESKSDAKDSRHEPAAVGTGAPASPGSPVSTKESALLEPKR
jgi:cytoskeletal protein CcmA (bactofilin family)